MRNSLFCWLMVVGMVGSAGADDGFLNINNFVNSTISIEPLMVNHYQSVGVSDGYDGSWDLPASTPFPNQSSLHSDISDIESNPLNNKIVRDYRLPSSTKDFLVKLVYNGNTETILSNHFEFSFLDSDYIFGSKPILFQSDLLPYGPVVDVRKAIAQNSGVVPLIDLPAGTYSTSTPYGEGILTIGTRKLADLSDNGDIDIEDFSMLAFNWGESGGKYVGDITGPNGIPDGNVDMYDLLEFVSEWLG